MERGQAQTPPGDQRAVGRRRQSAPAEAGHAARAAGRPTMRDVALLAEVDASTVSRALSPATRHMVSPETAYRVQAAAQRLGYRMNSLARGLRLNKTMAVGMVLPDISNPFFPPVVRGAEDELARLGRSLIVMNTDDDVGRETAAIEQLVERHVDALILATSHLASRAPASALDTPCVLVNRVSHSESTPSVVPDDRRGVRQAVRHLVRLGHRRIVHIAGTQDTSTGLLRRREFEAACASFGVAAEVLEAAAFTQEAGREAAAGLLAGQPPSAVIAANDLLAIGCLQAAAEAGVRVPEEMSVIGYDDVPMVGLLHPPLTTVRVPQYRMGQEAARLVVAAIQSGGTERLSRRHVQVTPRLIIRGSTAPYASEPAGQSQGRLISDQAWSRVAPILGADGDARSGRWRDHRQIFEAIAWRARTGRPWRSLPERFGPWQTAWKRFDLWNRDGTWERLRAAAAGDPELAAELSWLTAKPTS